jgi:WD40 repeat protein
MKLRKQFEGHSFGIGCIAWCPFSRYIIACGTDECNELWIWDVEVIVHKNDEYNSLFFFDL